MTSGSLLFLDWSTNQIKNSESFTKWLGMIDGASACAKSPCGPATCDCKKVKQILLHDVGFECPTTETAFIQWQSTIHWPPTPIKISGQKPKAATKVTFASHQKSQNNEHMMPNPKNKAICISVSPQAKHKKEKKSTCLLCLYYIQVETIWRPEQE